MEETSAKLKSLTTKTAALMIVNACPVAEIETVSVVLGTDERIRSEIEIKSLTRSSAHDENHDLGLDDGRGK